MTMKKTVTLHTQQGEIKIRLMTGVAPKACENFVNHATKGYYDNLIFHRVISGFMIQGGDPTGTGMGGQSIWGKPFEDECDASVKFDRKGLLAMANSGPNTNGSQFFITTAAATWLQGMHTIFGEVIEGYTVVEKIENAATGLNDKPVHAQTISKITTADE